MIVLSLWLPVASAWITDPLRYGSPESVGLLSAPLQALRENTSSYTVPRNYSSASYNKIHPLYPGATVLVGHQNTIVSHFAVGNNLLYSDANGTYLPQDQQTYMQKDTIYDLASLSKLWTTILVLDQLGQGSIQLNGTVATYLPDFAKNNKSTVTVLQLLTHTSGFEPDPEPGLYTSNFTSYGQRRKYVIEYPLTNPPGDDFVYSDLNFMNLAFMLEEITGCGLDELLQKRIINPLGLKNTFYNKGNNNYLPQLNQMEATEYQIQVLGPEEPQRPQPVRGTVHDENAWSLNGVAGHAGVFSTAYDLAVFCQMILNNGSYAGIKILEPWTVDLIFHNFNTKFPNDAHGVGFELNQTYWSGPMRSVQTAGHTGFTGTTLTIDRPTKTFWLTLTNRVHPNRNWSSTNIAREWAGYFIAQALGRNPKNQITA